MQKKGPSISRNDIIQKKLKAIEAVDVNESENILGIDGEDTSTIIPYEDD